MDTEYYYSPVGILEIKASNKALISVNLKKDYKAFTSSNNPVIKETIKQLSEYFEGKRRTFDIPLSPEGTEFQKKVWKELLCIPYGKTISYANLAEAVGNPKASRAVGSANGKNPIPIIIPCHRVIASDKGLGGYAYGLPVKKYLLELENKLT